MTSLFYAVLKAGFQGSIVILAVLFLRLVLKRAPKSLFCLLWLLAGLRLVLPFEIESNLSLQPEYTLDLVREEAAFPEGREEIRNSNAGTLLGTPVQPEIPAPEQSSSLPAGEWEELESESYLYKVKDGIVTGPLTFDDIAAPVWLLGMGIMVLASLWSYRKLKRRVREAYRTENGCFECPGLDTAFVLGFLPPRIYLPMGLGDQEKKFIFDHENTHIARGDHWCKLLGYLVLSLHWFNPLVWLGYSLLCRDIELACDEHVVKYMTLPERKAYSAALLSCGGHTARIAACPVAFGESNPKKRILNVLNYKRPGFWISLIAVIAVIFVAVCLLTSPSEEQTPEKPDTNPWNLEMEVADVTPVGLQVKFVQTGLFPGSDRATLQYGSEYTLEKWADGDWEDVQMLPQEYVVAWTTEAHLISLNSTTAFNVDWEWLYGELPAGKYRIGKGVTLFYSLTRETENQTFYAEFVIEETQPAWNMEMTEEEFLAMCRSAVADIRNRETYHISETLVYTVNDREDARSQVAYWGDGANYVRQSYVTRTKETRTHLYHDGQLYYRVQMDDGDPSWGLVENDHGEQFGMTWLHLLDWDAQLVTFEYAEDVEGVLHVFVTVHSTPQVLGWDDVTEYTVGFFFDQAGRLTNVLMGGVREEINVMSDLRIETTPAANIREKIESFASQRPEGLAQKPGAEELEKCRTALESYRAQGIWAIQLENSFSGPGAMNTSSISQWFGCGNDVMEWDQVPGHGGTAVWRRLRVDGECYHREAYYATEDASESWDNGWQPGTYDNQPMSPPWPLWYKWDAADIQFVEVVTDETDDSAEYVTFTVQGSPFPDDSGEIREYQVTFRFRNDVLLKIDISYTSTDSWGDDTYAQKTYDLYAFTSKDVEKKLSQCHSEAMQHIHDNYGIACTVEGCTNPDHHHDDHHH